MLRQRLEKKLTGFTVDVPDESARAEMVAYCPERMLFPVPELVLFALRDVLGWRWHGVGEKVRWTVYGGLESQCVAFELRKFGFTVVYPKDRPDLRSRIEGQLRSALCDVGAYLAPFAEDQVSRGEVMIVNRHSEFYTRYRFFRELAAAAYKRGATPPPAIVSAARAIDDPAAAKAISVDITSRINARMSADREGFFHSTAMVDSYFSCLEHRLVLLRAFTGRPFAEGEVLKILAMSWDDKLKLVLPSPLPPHAGDLLGRMRRIKERIRNPFAHGGIENDRGSLFFRLPKIGAIPANFTRFGNSVRFSMLPVDLDDHAESCVTFDALDVLLAANGLSGPDQFVKAGVDPVFDVTAIQEYAGAVAGGSEAIESYVEAWSSRWEQHVNMDY